MTLLTRPSKTINIKAAQVLSNLAMNEKNQECLKVMEMKCLTFEDCRLQLGLNSALVSLNFNHVSLNSTQVSLFTISFQEWKWECDI